MSINHQLVLVSTNRVYEANVTMQGVREKILNNNLWLTRRQEADLYPQASGESQPAQGIQLSLLWCPRHRKDRDRLTTSPRHRSRHHASRHLLNS